MCKLITPVVNGVISNIIEGKIAGTIEEKMLVNKYNDDEIRKETKAFFNRDDANIPNLILKWDLL